MCLSRHAGNTVLSGMSPKRNIDETPAGPSQEARDQRVELAFLEGVRTRLPRHPAILEALGCLYTEMGRYQDGLQADRDSVCLQPASPLAWYNLACSLSLTGQVNDAFHALEKAVTLGYADAEWMQKDADFAPIRSDPRFGRILARLMAGRPDGA